MFVPKRHFLATVGLLFVLVFFTAACSKEKDETKNEENNFSSLEDDQSNEIEQRADKYQAIMDLFVQKYNKSPEDVEITFTSESDNHLRGGVKFGGENGAGGIFLAVRQDTVWQLIFDGNGSFSCALLDQYGFPREMKEGCYIPPKVTSIVDQITWRDYKNEDLGYSLSYPGICNVVSTNVNDRIDFICNWQDDGTWPRFIITHHDSDFYHPTPNVSVVEWVEKHPELDLGAAIKIAGLETVHFVQKKNSQTDAADYYYFIKDGQLYEIIIMSVSGHEDKQLYDKFLSSFSFNI
ncbi:hypothetical protein C4566_02720 [Candidatus Parcubacteria bacterium]|nr:MAG: hypothetical protein C4566_02720 [Candidatus Parcubacteria bacterium]